jgi:HK97 family phage prohead protease
MQTKAFRLDVKTLDESGTFEGRLAVYNTADLGGDVIERGAFNKTLGENSTVPLLWGHDPTAVIGVLELRDTPTALMARGKLSLEVEKGREAYSLLKMGAVRGLSIGFRSLKDFIQDGVRHLKEIRLFEGSLTPTPMHPEALVTAVKAVPAPERNAEIAEAIRAAVLEIRRLRG